MRIQRRLELAFALILQDLRAFLIGTLCRLEILFSGSLFCQSAWAEAATPSDETRTESRRRR
jgi:hypothetical protein